MAGIRYSIPKNPDDYKKLLRQFTLDKLLMRINQESATLFIDESSDEMNGTVYRTINTYMRGSTIPNKTDVHITAWDLIDLAYYAICTTNDYRGTKEIHDVDISTLVVATQSYKGEKEKNYLDEIKVDSNNVLIYMWEFAGEQFKIQRAGNVFENIKRELYILLESSKVCKSNHDIEKIVLKQVGVSYKTVLASLLYAWCASAQLVSISDFEYSTIWESSILSKSDFHTVIEKYTATYNEIKESSLGRQSLYLTPYIRTSRNEIISINVFLTFFAFEHSILWIVRDYYQKIGSQQFTNAFGTYFEHYFSELLSTYLNSEEYFKIPEGKTKRADWKLELGEYKFLIEQKSTLMKLAGKQQNPDIEVAKSFGRFTVIKALRQLENTEVEFGDCKYIKVILLYEDYLKSEILENIFQLKECDVVNDRYYWLVTIREMEMLLSLYKSDRESFERVINEKIRRETVEPHIGRDITSLLNDENVIANKYLELNKFKKYDIENIIDEYK